jgi:hypothetical protein
MIAHVLNQDRTARAVETKTVLNKQLPLHAVPVAAAGKSCVRGSLFIPPTV